MRQLKIALIVIIATIVLAVPVAAQSDGSSDSTDSLSEPVNETESPITGTVSGEIVNGTDGEEVPGGLEPMLHVWDARFNDKFMLHGEAEADGSFRFDDVSFETGSFYAVMVNYQEVTYFSTPLDVPEGERELNLDIAIFESTGDTSQVQIENMHVFFDTAQGGLMVAEVYSFSNQGDKTVRDVLRLEDGSTATFRFSLPEAAATIKFEGNRNGRFITEPGGFLDTFPLMPGTSSGQVAVSYVLPYIDELTYSKRFDFPASGVKFLLGTELGLVVEGDGLELEGTRPMGEGKDVAIFGVDAIESGETVQVTVSGKIQNASSSAGGAMQAEAPSSESSPSSIALGGLLLGLALMLVGIWWYRQSDEEAVEFDESTDDMLAVSQSGLVPLQTNIRPDDKGEEADVKQQPLEEPLVQKPVLQTVEPLPDSDSSMG